MPESANHSIRHSRATTPEEETQPGNIASHAQNRRAEYRACRPERSSFFVFNCRGLCCRATHSLQLARGAGSLRSSGNAVIRALLASGGGVKESPILEDDLDGSHADQTVIFALDGISYEIDLSDAHANNLRSAFRPYNEAARKISPSRVRGRRTHESRAPSSVRIRAWAEEQGLSVNARGKIRGDVLEKYQAAHAERP